MLLNCGVGKDSWESLGLQGDQTWQFQRKSMLNIHWKDWCWSWSSNTLAPDAKSQLPGKDPDAGKDWKWKEKGMTEDEMVGWHHWLNGYEFEQVPIDGEKEGGLACCGPWSCKKSDTNEWLNVNWMSSTYLLFVNIQNLFSNIIMQLERSTIKLKVFHCLNLLSTLRKELLNFVHLKVWGYA